MCSVFGLLDYQGRLTPAERLRIIRTLGNAAEIRGTDATGIAYVQGDGIHIQKAPRPAHLMHYRISPDARYIMGHTRATTQGNESFNPNNHPFPGKAGKMPFALTHNGMLFNDLELRREHRLPRTKIQTDSYVAAQLLEKWGEVSHNSLKRMAELLRGTFTITVLDGDNNLYFVRGNNPLTIYLFPERGFYLYASTTEILDAALLRLGMAGEVRTGIKVSQGDILQIKGDGKRVLTRFDDAHLSMRSCYYYGGYYDWYPIAGSGAHKGEKDDYLEEVIRYGGVLGIPETELRLLAEAGYDAFDLEELLWDKELRQWCLDEITCELEVR